MTLLIDGYNLLHATGIVGPGRGPSSLHRAREGLLSFLAASIEAGQRKRTTIIFDATHAPAGLPRTTAYAEITVRYASDYPDADTLIEELIQQHDAPRSLLVVSSDHRIQRAARRRRARFVDSDHWYAELRRHRTEAQDQLSKSIPAKPPGKLSAEEIDYWVQKFSADEMTDNVDAAATESSAPASNAHQGLKNPFPPGYGEELLREEKDTDA